MLVDRTRRPVLGQLRFPRSQNLRQRGREASGGESGKGDEGNLLIKIPPITMTLKASAHFLGRVGLLEKARSGLGQGQQQPSIASIPA